jgi:glucose dehydrogenase
VAHLQVVWRRPAVDEKLTQAFPDLSVGTNLRSTPIMIDGMLFTQDAHGFMNAFDPGTGATIWQQEPFARTSRGDRPKHSRRRLLARWQRSPDQGRDAAEQEWILVCARSHDRRAGVADRRTSG